MMECRPIDVDSANWAELDSFGDRTVFQTRAWLEFVSETQKATPIILELRDSGLIAGYFSGLTFTRFGVKILGSSFPGWTTPYIGFNLASAASRMAALEAVERFAWDHLSCLHMEVSDPYFTASDGQRLGFECDFYHSYRTDLTRPEKAIFDGMDSACRRCIRKAEKSGVSIEEAHDPQFADDFYEQLKGVFAKQGLVPTYRLERVRTLVRKLEPTGHLLLLRAKDRDGKCIATGIFPGFNKIAEFWGNASLRESQILRPNELIHWYAMRYWKQHGAEIYDWGGGGKYKEKYGCQPHAVPWFTKSRYRFVSALRNQAKDMFARKQRLVGWLTGAGSARSEQEEHAD
jgi:hypothetical protein